MEILCKRLKQLRKEKNLTQTEFGKVIGVKKGAISYYESGKTKISIEDLAKIATEFNKSMDYFVGHDYYTISDERDGYGNNAINMSIEEIKFIKAIRKESNLYQQLLQNPDNLVSRMKIKL